MAVALAAASGAFAAMQKITTVQVGNTTELVAAGAKLGELTGNQMIAGMATAALMQNKLTEFFGPMRQGEPLPSALFDVYVDIDKIGAAGGDAFDATLLYPVVGTKEKFLKGHPGSAEKNGVIKLGNGSLFKYAAFSADGKWMAAGGNSALVLAAANRTAAAAAGLRGNALRVSSGPKELSVILAAVDKYSVANPETVDDRFYTLLKSVTSFDAALKISNAGLDISASTTQAAGSVLAKFGLNQLGGDPFAFASSDVVFACAETAGARSGTCKLDYEGQVKTLLGMLRKIGVDSGKFLDVAVKGCEVKCTVDVAAAVRYGMAATTNGVADAIAANCASNGEEIVKTFNDNFSAKELVPSTKPLYASLAVKNYKGGCSMSQRYAASLPAVARKSPFSACVFSYVSLFRAALPPMLSALDEETRAGIQPMLSMMPQEAKGAVAAATWRHGESFRHLMRITPDELKGIGAIVNTVMSIGMMRSAQRARTDDDDSDDN